jgi:agmatine deiminase
MPEKPFVIAEWEGHSCCLMAWPWRSDVWEGELLGKIQADILSLAKAISEYEPVVMLVPRRETLQPKFNAQEWPGTIHCVAFDYDDIWVRDTAPIWLSDGTAIDPRFNAWGHKNLPNGRRIPHRRDAGFAKQLCNALDVQTRDFGLTLEGGALESDGRGRLLLTKSNMLSGARNGLPDSVEAERFVQSTIAEQLNANIEWLPGGHDEMDVSDGHVDAIARLTPSGAVLYDDYDADTSVAQSSEYQAIAVNASAVQRMAGKAFPLRRPRGLLASNYECYSYANFYVANGAVFVPSFQRADRASEEAIHRQIGEQFPDRKIVPIQLPTLARDSGGGIHCVVRDVPDAFVVDDLVEKLESWSVRATGLGGRVEADEAYVVKLGAQRFWTDECLGRGTIRFGFNNIPEGNEGQHESMGLFWPHEGRGSARSIWITFSEGLLWWTRPTGQPVRYLGLKQENSSRDKELACQAWSCTNAKGQALHVQRLPGAVQQLQFTRSTGSRVNEAATQPLLQMLNGTPSDTHRGLASLLGSQSELRALSEQAICALSPKNLESLVDMMFVKAGFLRLTEFGGTMLDIDGLYQSNTLVGMAFRDPADRPKRIGVQVKQRAGSQQLESYRRKLSDYDSEFADEFWFIVAQPEGLDANAISPEPRFRYVGPEQLIEWAIELGFLRWLLTMSSF